MGTVNTHKHVMTADHSRYDVAMTKSSKKTDKLSNSSRSLVSSIALIDGPLGGVASRASNLNTILRTGGIVMGSLTVASSALGFGMVKLLKVVSEVEVEMGKTNAILRATGHSAGVFSEELDVLARDVARATLASTTQIRQAIGSLATFRSVTRPIFADVIRLSQDMAAVWGGSAATNARKLGKSLDDPVKQLSRLETTVGAFNTEQREMILEAAKAGEQLKAQKLIIEALQERIGDASVGSGLAYSVDSLGQAWDELFESIDKTTGTSSAVSSWIDQLTRGIDRVTKSMEPLTANELFGRKLELEMVITNSDNGVQIYEAKKELAEIDALLAKTLEKENALTMKNGELYEQALKRRKEEAEQLRLKKEKEDALRREEIYMKEILKDGEEILRQVERTERAEKARLERLSKDVAAIRDDGLSPLAQEKELHQQNIDTLLEYQKTYGESARITEAIAAEKRRTLEAQNDAVFSERSSFLENSLGGTEDYNNFDDEIEQHANRVAKIMEYREQDVLNHRASMEQLEEEQERHSEAIAKIYDFEAKQKEKAQKDFFSNASSLMNSQSRKLFEIGKAAAISNAIISATEAVPHAYKWGTKIGGPVLGAAFAATAIAATTAQIQAINDTSFGSKSTSTSSGASSTGVAEAAQAQSNSNSVEIHFNGDVSGLNAEVLADTLKDYIDQTDFILVDRASRNGQELAA